MSNVTDIWLFVQTGTKQYDNSKASLQLAVNGTGVTLPTESQQNSTTNPNNTINQLGGSAQFHWSQNEDWNAGDVTTGNITSFTLGIVGPDSGDAWRPYSIWVIFRTDTGHYVLGPQCPNWNSSGQGFSTDPTDSGCKQQWPLPWSRGRVWTPFLGYLPSTLALPDYYSNYFAYSFDRENYPTLGLRISGDFGYARYMSYNIYDERTAQSLGALRDVEINPLPNNVNPFVPGNSSDATNRKYTINVYCSDDPPPANALTFSSDVTVLVVMLRYYVPVGTPLANVSLPTIEAFDTQTGASVPLPSSLVPARMPVLLYEPTLAKIFETISDQTLSFYYVQGGGEFNNADNAYLICAVEKQPDQVLLVNLQTPQFAHDNSENDSADVRYWSFNQGNADTSTPAGTPDCQFQVAKDGRTYIAIGDESIEESAQELGYNFMLWQATSPKAVILYRNLVTRTDPPFPGIIDTANVRLLSLPLQPGQNLEDYAAVNSKNPAYVPYAPTGLIVSQSEFMNGGYPSPGFMKEE